MKKITLKRFFSLLTFLFILLTGSVEIQAQIFPGQFPPNGANSAPGNPDAIVPVNAILDGDTFVVNGVEACITGGGGNNGSPGENPEWRFDIILPNASEVLPVSENIEIRVCRRGDFGQAGEGLRILDENLVEIGLIPGDQSGVNTDCSDGPICLTVTVSSCAFNAQAADGVFSLTLDGRNVGGPGGTVGDFCNVPPGPRQDSTPGGCPGPNCGFSQVTSVVVNGATVNGFDNQNNGGPMVNITASAANCAFVDYFVFPTGGLAFTIDGVDALDLDGEDYCVGESLFIPSASGAGQNFTVSIDGGPRQSIGGGGTDVTFIFVEPGSYEVCNTIDPGGCAEERCIMLNVVAPPPGDPGPDDTICQTEPSYSLSGANVMADTILWTSSGDGFFDNPAGTNPVYTLGSTDVNANNIQLSVTVSNNDGICDPTTNSLILSISEISQVEAGPNASLCADFTSYTLAGSSASGGATTGIWTVTTNPGDGAVSPAGPTANPEMVLFTATTPGTYVLTLTTNAEAPCPEVSDTVTIVVDPAPTSSVGTDKSDTICSTDTYSFVDGISTDGTIVWTTSGNGIFSSTSIDNPEYTPSANDITAGTITLTKTVNGIDNCLGVPASDEFILTINQDPMVDAGMDTILCIDFGSYQLADATIGGGASTGIWTVTTNAGDGAVSPATATPTPETATFTATAAGVYVLTLTTDATAPCTPATDTVTITVEEPELNSIQDLLGCAVTPIVPLDANDAVTFDPNIAVVWYDALTGGSIVNNPILDMAGSISYFAEIVNTDTSCVNPERQEVVLSLVDPPFPDFTEAVCSGESINFNVSSVIPSYTVVSSDELNVPAGPNRTTPSAVDITDTYINTTSQNVTITYTLTVSNPAACAGEVFDIVVTVSPEPVVSNTLEETVCSDDAIGVVLATSASSTPAASWRLISISPDAGLIAAPSNAVTTTGLTENAIVNDMFTNPTTAPLTVAYSVEATSTAGCLGQPETFNVTIDPAPTASVGTDKADTICSIEMYTFIDGTSFGGAINWTSSGSGNFSSTTAENPTYTPSSGDITAGVVTLTKTVIGAGSCERFSMSDEFT